MKPSDFKEQARALADAKDKEILEKIAELGKQMNEERIETGVVQFGDDWPGVFIRGDNAIHFRQELLAALSLANSPEVKMFLDGLIELLGCCNQEKIAEGDIHVQHLTNFGRCKRNKTKWLM